MTWLLEQPLSEEESGWASRRLSTTTAHAAELLQPAGHGDTLYLWCMDALGDRGGGGAAWAPVVSLAGIIMCG